MRGLCRALYGIYKGLYGRSFEGLFGCPKGSIGKGFGSPFWPVLEGPNRGQNGSNLEASKEPLSDPIRPPWEGLEGPL